MVYIGECLCFDSLVNTVHVVVAKGIKNDPDSYSDVTLGQPRGKIK